jgi:hypothetical protein
VHGIVKTNGHADREVFEHLVNLTVRALDQGRPTRFAFQGCCHQILRVRFILNGQTWVAADRLAEAIVRRALDMIGARRPSWAEAQDTFTRIRGTGRLFCANEDCGRPIERESFQVMGYCSEPCRKRAKHRRAYAEHQADRRASAQARRDRRRAQAEPRTCQRCGVVFQPLDVRGQPPQRYCGRECGRRFASALRGIIGNCDHRAGATAN